MFAPIGMTWPGLSATMSRRSTPLSGIANTPYNDGDIHDGGSVSQMGRIRPATKSAPVSSTPRTRPPIHSPSGCTSSSVKATRSPRVNRNAAFTACDFPVSPTNTYRTERAPARAAACSTTRRVSSLDPLSATTISRRSCGHRWRATASSVCPSSALRLRVAITTETNIGGVIST